MEREECVETSSLSAQEILIRMSNYQQILLLAKDLEADTIRIYANTIII